MKSIMKRALALALALVFVLATAESSVVYAAPKHHKETHSHSSHSVSNKHAHVFNRAVTEKWTDATCEDYATQTWACSKYVTKNGKKVLCSEEVTIVTGKKLAHKYVSTATEESEGVYQCACGAVEYVACKGCKEYRLFFLHIPHAVVKVAPKLPHTHVEVEDAAVDATCDTPGLTAGSHCGTCGEVLVAQEVIEAEGHVWNEGNVEYAPTCRDNGTMYYFCTVDGCDANKTEVIPALGHEIVVVDYKAPTCTEEGNYAYEMCTRCGGKDVSATIPALGHDWEVLRDYSSCTLSGEKISKCTICKERKFETAPAKGHTWATVAAKAPTCTEVGYNEYQLCTDCGQPSGYVEIPATGKHTNFVFDVKVAPQGTSFGIADEKCADCGKVVMTNVEICYHHEYSWICKDEACVYTAQVTKR